MIQIFEPIEPSEFKPRAIIEFTGTGDAPSLELHVWEFGHRTQVEWINEDGVSLGMRMGADC